MSSQLGALAIERLAQPFGRNSAPPNFDNTMQVVFGDVILGRYPLSLQTSKPVRDTAYAS